MVPCKISGDKKSTWWLIPLSKWVITPVINGISRVNPHNWGYIPLTKWDEPPSKPSEDEELRTSSEDISPPNSLTKNTPQNPRVISNLPHAVSPFSGSRTFYLDHREALQNHSRSNVGPPDGESNSGSQIGPLN